MNAQLLYKLPLLLGAALCPLTAQGDDNSSHSSLQAGTERAKILFDLSEADSSQTPVVKVLFPEDMVNNDSIGKAVEPGILNFTPAREFTAMWSSPSCISVRLTQPLPVMQRFRLRLTRPMESLQGRRIATQSSEAIQRRNDYFLNKPYSVEIGEAVLFSAEPDYDDYLEQVISRCEYVIYDSNSGETRHLPCNVRPARVEDARKNWDIFTAASSYSVNDNDREGYMCADPMMEIPHMWRAEPLDIEKLGQISDNTVITLRLRDFDPSAEEERRNLDICRVINSPFRYDVNAQRTSHGEFQVKIHFNSPISPNSIPKDMKWILRDLEGKNIDLQKVGEGHWTAQYQGRDFDLRYDEEASRAANKEEKGYKNLVLQAKTGGVPLMLFCDSRWTDLRGRVVDSAAMTEAKRYGQTCAALRAETPQLSSDLLVGCLQSGGGTKLRYAFRNMEELNLRVIKAPNSGAEAIRLLATYFENYSPAARLLPEAEDENSCDEEDKKKPTVMSLKSLAGLPEYRRCLSRNCDERGEISLGELFPRPKDAPSTANGLYFVEMEGRPIQEWNNKGEYINQALLQVTDLGMMWKRCGQQLMVYAYRLSDGSPLPAAQLRCYGGAAQELAQAEVKDGVALLPLPQGLQFLQLQCGEDCFSLRCEMRDNADLLGYMPWTEQQLGKLGIAPEDFPQLRCMAFTDRKLYRAGETIHAKGMLRWLKGNSLSIPQVESIECILSQEGNEKTYPMTVEKDGSFHADIPAPAQSGSVRLDFNYRLKGDEDGSAPDKVLLAEAKQRLQDDKKAQELDIDLDRSHCIFLSVQDFRRNEFEQEGSLQTSEDGKSLTLESRAMKLDGSPLQDAKVTWTYRYIPRQPEIEGLENFSFQDEGAQRDESTQSREGVLDKKGLARCYIPASPAFRSPATLQVDCNIRNANGQSLIERKSYPARTSQVYAGMKTDGDIAPSGKEAEIPVALITADDKLYEGEPLDMTFTVTRKTFAKSRFGCDALSQVRNSPVVSKICEQKLRFSGRSCARFMPEGPGIYTLTLGGKDATGNSLRCSQELYVYGPSEDSVWQERARQQVTLVANRASYKTGDTAEILVQSSVNAQALVTLEREKVLRHFLVPLNGDKPTISIPLKAEDAPGVYVSVYLVQSDASIKSANGKPQQKHGSLYLKVQDDSKKLCPQFELPKGSVLNGQEMELKGSICDAAGKPVPQAKLTLYAVDEGDLQVTGYTLPDAYAAFNSEREKYVYSYSSMGYVLRETLGKRDYGNKGVFIGGGGEEGDTPDSSMLKLRDNFEPTAVWLADLDCDAQGRFSCRYKNPDTMTRYRVMAVASAGADRFGSGQSAYQVNKPVMLEPSAPLSAVENDLLDLPVTLTLRPDQLPAGSPEKIAWRVSLTAENAVLPQGSEKIVESHGQESIHLNFPLRLGKAGESRLTWSVRPVENSGTLKGLGDAVRLSFPVLPPSPLLREVTLRALQAGESSSISELLYTDYRPENPISLTLSANPLSGAMLGMNYLFKYPYGCLEQTASTLLPWIYQQQFRDYLGVNYLGQRKAQEVVSEGINKLRGMRIGNSCFKMSYWPRGTEPSSFSAYANLVLYLAEASQNSSQTRATEDEKKELLRQLCDKKQHQNILWLYSLAVRGDLSRADLDAVARRGGFCKEEAELIALSAYEIGHPKAAELATKALAMPPSSTMGFNAMPPEEALRCLLSIAAAPQSSVTQKLMQDYVRNSLRSARRCNTWSSGWLCLTLHEYLKKSGAEKRQAVVNGKTLSGPETMLWEGRRDDTRLLKVQKGELYVTGLNEGYTSGQQPPAAVNNGFEIRRNYEILGKNGQWIPATEVRVGDIVRITLAVAPSIKGTSEFVAIEDRLPSCFEAVNPELTSQQLPEEVMSSGIRIRQPINHTEYYKDHVSFFADKLPARGISISYLARAVKSGSVTAPAAQASMMYRPQNYGLSIPQFINVKPE